MVSTTRPMSCLIERSRCAVPGFPWKYFWATMFVAVIDHVFGTSTSFCSKNTSPFSFVIAAVRSSHSRESKGCVAPSVKSLRKVRPLRPPRVRAPGCVFSVCISGAVLRVSRSSEVLMCEKTPFLRPKTKRPLSQLPGPFFRAQSALPRASRPAYGAVSQGNSGFLLFQGKNATASVFIRAAH